jgi:hypothetical protein
MDVQIRSLLVLSLVPLACGGGASDSGGSTAGSSSATDGSGTGSSMQTTTDDPGTAGVTTEAADDTAGDETAEPPPTECEPFGRFGAPRSTFVLPVREGASIYYPDVQASFPEVDWAQLDRLYVPAGQYPQMSLGNLPQRSADDPLVITNMGGQVRIGPPAADANYLWAMGGGSGWVLTGRWDPDSGTGDESAPGHRCGDYAGARGHYGFWSDDAFTHRDYLHMGLAVTGAAAYEIEHVEIERSGFAGLRLLNPWSDGELPMADVRVHDNYIHDVDGEGLYFGWTGGPPSNLAPGLQVYNNRLVRTGNEALQIQDIGDGSEIHHNVIAFAALHWRDNGLGAYQDGNSQISIREGEVSIHHNVFMGGAGVLGSFWSQPQAGDGPRTVSFHDNYLADVRNLAFYFGGQSEAGSSFTFADNALRGLEFSYDDLDPAATAPTAVFSLAAAIGGDVQLTGNRWEGELELVQGGIGPTVMDNTQGPVEAVEFVDSGYPEGVPVLRLEAWTEVSTLAPGSPPREYVVGELVMYDGQLYECITDNTGQVPPRNPGSWMQLPAPVDDLRVVAGSAHEGLGIE